MAELSDASKNLREKVSLELTKTFDTLAKLALQGSSESQDPSLEPTEKLRKAHSRITLIIDDAMSGLAKAHQAMYASFMALGFEIGCDSSAEDSPENAPAPR